MPRQSDNMSSRGRALTHKTPCPCCEGLEEMSNNASTSKTTPPVCQIIRKKSAKKPVIRKQCRSRSKCTIRRASRTAVNESRTPSLSTSHGRQCPRKTVAAKRKSCRSSKRPKSPIRRICKVARKTRAPQSKSTNKKPAPSEKTKEVWEEHLPLEEIVPEPSQPEGTDETVPSSSEKSTEVHQLAAVIQQYSNNFYADDDSLTSDCSL